MAANLMIASLKKLHALRMQGNALTEVLFQELALIVNLKLVKKKETVLIMTGMGLRKSTALIAGMEFVNLMKDALHLVAAKVFVLVIVEDCIVHRIVNQLDAQKMQKSALTELLSEEYLLTAILNHALQILNAPQNQIAESEPAMMDLLLTSITA